MLLARVTDMHLCPMVTPGVPPIPHVGGPIVQPSAVNVLVGGLPPAGTGSMCTCVGPPDSIIAISTVMVGGKPVAKMGDATVHGGSIILGCPTVIIGTGGAAGAAASAASAAASAASEAAAVASEAAQVMSDLQDEQAQLQEMLDSGEELSDEEMERLNDVNGVLNY